LLRRQLKDGELSAAKAEKKKRAGTNPRFFPPSSRVLFAIHKS